METDQAITAITENRICLDLWTIATLSNPLCLAWTLHRKYQERIKLHASVRSSQIFSSLCSSWWLSCRPPGSLLLTRISQMNSTGMFTVIMTALLLLTVCGSALRSSTRTNNTWIGMRSLYYFAGIIVSGIYLSYISGRNSSNMHHFSSLSWNNFVPLVFCIFGLLHSAVVLTTRPRSNDYSPHIENEDLTLRDEPSS